MRSFFVFNKTKIENEKSIIKALKLKDKLFYSSVDNEDIENEYFAFDKNFLNLSFIKHNIDIDFLNCVSCKVYQKYMYCDSRGLEIYEIMVNTEKIKNKYFSKVIEIIKNENGIYTNLYFNFRVKLYMNSICLDLNNKLPSLKGENDTVDNYMNNEKYFKRLALFDNDNSFLKYKLISEMNILNRIMYSKFGIRRGALLNGA